jgi:hypothetical protein
MGTPSFRGGRIACSYDYMTQGLRAVRLGRLSDAFPGTLGVLGSLLILLGTSRYGVGLSPDSASYIAAARSLLAGRGYLDYTGDPLVLFPPLYPTLIALGTLLWPDPISVARYANALSFGLIVFLSSRWLTRQSNSLLPPLIGSLLVLLSVPLIRVSVYAWTECVFILFTLLFLLQIERYRGSSKDMDVLLSAAFAALAFLMRYIGFTVILTGAALVLLHRDSSLPRKIRHIVTFLTVSLAPIALWFLRNRLSYSTFTGGRFPGVATLSGLTYTMVNTITSWWLPELLPFPARVALSAMIVALVVGGGMVALWRNQARFVICKVSVCIPMLLFIGVYIGFLLVSLLYTAADPPDNRYLAPVYVPLVLVLTILVVTAGKGTRFLWNKPTQSLVAVCLAVWILYPASQATALINTYLDNGAGGFHQTRWARSDLLDYLALHDLDGLIYNNHPSVLYFATGRIAKRSPRKYGLASRLPTNDLVTFEKSLAAGRPVYLVWFDGAGGEYSYSVEEIRARFDMEQVAQRADGSIYVVRGKKQ